MVDRPSLTPTQQLAYALLSTVMDAGPNGVPSGPMYMACNTKGVTLDQYQGIMDALVRAKLLRLSNHCYYYTGPTRPADA